MLPFLKMSFVQVSVGGDDRTHQGDTERVLPRGVRAVLFQPHHLGQRVVRLQ